MTHVTLTPMQLKILEYIHRYRNINKQSPTFREMAEEMQRAQSTIRDHVELLIKKGFLERLPHRSDANRQARSIVPTRVSPSAPECHCG